MASVGMFSLLIPPPHFEFGKNLMLLASFDLSDPLLVKLGQN
jgi:hypothetical protein